MNEAFTVFITDGDMLMYGGLSLLALLSVAAFWQGRGRRASAERREAAIAGQLGGWGIAQRCPRSRSTSGTTSFCPSHPEVF